MKFLADESVDFPIVKLLRENNFEVDYIAEIKPGITDKQVINLANQKKRILITADKDFGEIVFRQRKISSGIVLYRLSGLANKEKSEKILSLIYEHQSSIEGNFTVITQKQIRIKNLPLQ